jgi:hypothetical protein
VKVRTLAVAAGVCAPLILTGSSDAGFVGLTATAKPNQFGLLVVNVYAEFDNPGIDQMGKVSGTPGNPLSITVVGGSFYNQPTFGGDLAPNSALFGLFPSLEFDTFVTIGVKATGPLGQPANGTTLVNYPTPIAGTSTSTSNGSWAILGPLPQGNPFDPINSYPGNGQILLGQFSTADGLGIQGTWLMGYTSDGVVTASLESFSHFAGPCINDEECDDGNPCNGEEWCFVDTGICMPGVPDPDCNENGVLDSCDIDQGTPDCNENGVPDECDLAEGTSPDFNGNGVPDECDPDCNGNGFPDFLDVIFGASPDCNENGVPDECDIADGTSPDTDGNGIPDECEGLCPWDCQTTPDGTVNISDFLKMLAQWGGPGSCDFDGDGVGFTDFVGLLAYWGPCP